MESVTRVPREDDHETSDEVRARFGELVVAYFLRAIDALDALPKGPELAVRRVWASVPTQLDAGARRNRPEAH